MGMQSQSTETQLELKGYWVLSFLIWDLRGFCKVLKPMIFKLSLPSCDTDMTFYSVRHYHKLNFAMFQEQYIPKRALLKLWKVSPAFKDSSSGSVLTLHLNFKFQMSRVALREIRRNRRPKLVGRCAKTAMHKIIYMCTSYVSRKKQYPDVYGRA